MRQARTYKIQVYLDYIWGIGIRVSFQLSHLQNKCRTARQTSGKLFHETDK